MEPIFELFKIQIARLLIDNRKELNKTLKGLEKKGPLTKEDFSLLDMFFDVPIENLITNQEELNKLNSEQTRQKTVSTIEQIEREVRGVVDRTDYIHTALKELKERVSSSIEKGEESKPTDPLNYGEFNWTPNVELGLGGINRKVVTFKRRRPDHIYMGPDNFYLCAYDFTKKDHSDSELLIKDLKNIIHNENHKSEQGCGQSIDRAVNCKDLNDKLDEHISRLYNILTSEALKQLHQPMEETSDSGEPAKEHTHQGIPAKAS